MRSLDETNRLLAEKEAELARLDARRAELLAQIAKLQQEKTPFPQLQETLVYSLVPLWFRVWQTIP